MINLNKILIVGNLCADPELRYGQSGNAFCNLRLASNHKIFRKDGTTQEETCFVDATTFGRSAEACNQYLKKGSRVLVEGRLAYSTWEKDGQKRSKHNIVAERVQFFPRTQNQGGQNDQGGQYDQAGASQQDVTNYGSSYNSSGSGDSAAGSRSGQSGYDGYGANDSYGGSPSRETTDSGQEHDHDVPF